MVFKTLRINIRPSQTVSSNLQHHAGFFGMSIDSPRGGAAPTALRREGSPLKYHHIGIPTTNKRPGEVYLEAFGMHVVGFENSDYGVEWLRFEPDSPLPDLVKTVPHVAFVVDDIKKAIEGKQVLIEPNSPSPGVAVAFIVENGAPIEFLSFDSDDHALNITVDGGGISS